MDDRDFEAIVVLAEEGHFGRAAERLRVSQPPLTKRIQRIEREVGFPLFERHRYGVRVRPEAQALLDDAKRLVAAHSHFTRVARDTKRGTAGLVSIGAVGSAFFAALPVLLRRCRQRCPQIELTVAERETPALLDALEAGLIDVGFARPPFGEGLESRVVWTEDLVTALPSDDPLAQEPEVSVDHLRSRGLVLFERSAGPGYWDRVNGLYLAAGVPMDLAATTDHVSTIIGMVAAGIGVGIVPRSTTRLALSGVTYAELTPRTELPLAVVFKYERQAIRSFLDTLPESPLYYPAGA